jgi:hypothetical protein
MAVNMPRMEENNINPYTVPGIVPAVLGIIIFTLALIMLFRSIKRSDFLPRLEKDQWRQLLKDGGTLRLLFTVIFCLVYSLLLIGHIPYILATFLFVFAFILSFDLKLDATGMAAKKIVVRAFIQALLTAAVVSSAFKYLFLVDLP